MNNHEVEAMQRIKEENAELRKQIAELRAVLAASENRRDAEIVAAATNLVTVKGRFNTEQAYKRLIAAIAAAGNKVEG